jgi:hypothetical protein
MLQFLTKQRQKIKNKRNLQVVGGTVWNLFTFSINGTVIKPNGTAAIANTPSNLLGNTRKLNVGKKYHSGKISNGVLNGSAGSPICVGARTDKPTQHANIPSIVTGKMYKISFGHAGSP